MAREIERKFLVTGQAWRTLGTGTLFRQGYLNDDKNRTVRLRTMGTRAVLTIKGPTVGIERPEFEYEIPLTDCEAMLESLALKPLVRLRTMGTRAVLTIKGPTVGIERPEFEYEIPLTDCEAMLESLALKPLIEKTRYRIPYRGFVWEVDEFHGVNEGLILAEIELPSAETAFEKPEWIGKEVSGDPRYFNSALITLPYTRWSDC